jgi:hypothetical protein
MVYIKLTDIEYVHISRRRTDSEEIAEVSFESKERSLVITVSELSRFPLVTVILTFLSYFNTMLFRFLNPDWRSSWLYSDPPHMSE